MFATGNMCTESELSAFLNCKPHTRIVILDPGLELQSSPFLLDLDSDSDSDLDSAVAGLDTSLPHTVYEGKNERL